VSNLCTGNSVGDGLAAQVRLDDVDQLFLARLVGVHVEHDLAAVIVALSRSKDGMLARLKQNALE